MSRRDDSYSIGSYSITLPVENSEAMGDIHDICNSDWYSTESQELAQEYNIIGPGNESLVVVPLNDTEDSDSDICIKIIFSNKLFTKEEQLENAQREVDALRAIHNDKRIQSLEQDNFIFIIQPRHKGYDLTTAYSDPRFTDLPFGERISLILTLIKKLKRLHKAGLVHRDLKPENVIVNLDADATEINLVDFGSVKPSDSQTTIIAGTTFNRAPEAAKFDANGEVTVDPRSDIYSLFDLIMCLLGQNDHAYGKDKCTAEDKLTESSEPRSDALKIAFIPYNIGKHHPIDAGRSNMPESMQGLASTTLTTFMAQVGAQNPKLRPSLDNIEQFFNHLQRLVTEKDDEAKNTTLNAMQSLSPLGTLQENLNSYIETRKSEKNYHWFGIFSMLPTSFGKTSKINAAEELLNCVTQIMETTVSNGDQELEAIMKKYCGELQSGRLGNIVGPLLKIIVPEEEAEVLGAGPIF